MLIAFGLSWPPAIFTALKTKTTKGKNVLFDVCIWFGYAFGIAAKFISGDVTYVMAFYLFNFSAATFQYAFSFAITPSIRIKPKR